MFLECAALCAVGSIAGFVQEAAAGLLMVIRHLGNGVDRLESFELGDIGLPLDGYLPLPSPLPASVADLMMSAGESADGASGWCRSVAEDLTELAIECGVSQGGD